MLLTEITVIKPSNRLVYKACDELCFLSKNLYNAILYIQRQNYQEGKPFISERNMRKLLREQKNPDFYALPSSPAEYVSVQVDAAYESYFLKLQKKERR